MKLKTIQAGGYIFSVRPDTSDEKTVKEVIERKVYLKKGMQINSQELWVDCGGNIGAFTVLAASKGAIVSVYEPDPNNCRMIEINLKNNNVDAKIICGALVSDDRKKPTYM